LWHNRGTKSGEARSIGCLTTQKSGEAVAHASISASSMVPPPMRIVSLFRLHFTSFCSSEIL